MNQDGVKSGYYAQVRPEIARLIVGQPKRILEVGCANGLFQQNITWPCKYYGVEPFAAAAEAARKNGIEVYEGKYQDVEHLLPEDSFDLIICNDVIEHMENPWLFLESIKRKCAKADNNGECGMIIGSVPNVRYLLNLVEVLVHRDWRYVDGGVLDRTHLRFFTPKSLRRLLDECGLKIEVLKPSGPDRFRWIKKLMAPFFWIMGVDVLYMQIAFRVSLTPSRSVVGTGT